MENKHSAHDHHHMHNSKKETDLKNQHIHAHHEDLKEKGQEELLKSEKKIDELTLHAHEQHAKETKIKHDHSGHSGMKMNHAAHGEAGHDHHAMMINDFRQRFWISLALAIPIAVLSPMIQHLIGYSIDFPGLGYLLFILSTVVFFYGGFPFLKGWIDEMKNKRPGMMTLIAVAIVVAYVYSSAIVFGLKGEMFFWELASLIVIMLLGHWLEMKSVQGASKALELLVKMIPSEASRIRGNNEEKVKIEDLVKGDVVLIRPGEKIPADGVIVEGESHIDESMLTGESKPERKTTDDKVIAGSVNQNGSLKVRVESTGKESYLSRVIDLVENAQKTKSQTQTLADKVAFWLTIVALVAGFATFFTWLALGKDLAFSLERMVTVMVISCPHALGLAIPLVVAISTSISAKNGLLIRNRTAFENSRNISMVVFDKTGTLTKGSHEVARVVSLDPQYNEKELTRLAAGLEQNSEHPISRGIIKRAKAEKLTIPHATRFNYIPGKGLEGTVEGREMKVVGPQYLKEFNIPVPKGAVNEAIETIVYVITENKIIGFITLADQIREDSFEAIETLKSHGIKTLLLTGDNEVVAKSVSEKLKMDGFLAGVLPHQKQEKIKELQAKGDFVAMSGDGVNDAPALAQADVGIAVGSGTDVAAETSDIVLVNSNPKDVVSLILFGRATYKKMIQNLIYATGYNIIAIPLAAGVLYSQGILISPALGAVLMSLSTIVVAINAQLLKLSK